ncbi:hypothetical protein PILCRDRAFT_91650 [Piloderma croceum F 1598]|uniref:Decapping nuclease n=1 Tax=Piloderma croceum (strain F 1598) TaxID=765440 RepID=A0A0C3F8Z4_PILCF|nr:hypothetical protein PILCRDRAFT_91650 [Piloderma croceum F 1598]
MNETAEYSSSVLISSPLHNENTPSQVPAIMGPPKQIACYSVNPTGVEFNTSSLRYFVTPPLGANLGKGCFSFMDRYKNVMQEPQRLDNVLLACLQADAKEYLLQADVVVRRGVLVKIMLRTKVQLNVSLIDGVLYIEEWLSKPNLESEEPTIAKSDVDPDVQWLSVISRQLGDLNIILSGEVDCIKGTLYQAAFPEVLRLMPCEGRYTGQPDTYLELKTKKTRTVDLEKGLIAWYKKSYLQSHLLGVSELLIGHHSNDILRRTELLQVHSCIVDHGIIKQCLTGVMQL